MAAKSAAEMPAKSKRVGHLSFIDGHGLTPPSTGPPGRATLGRVASRAGRQTAPAREQFQAPSLESKKPPASNRSQSAGGPSVLKTVTAISFDPARSCPDNTKESGFFQFVCR